MLTKNDILKDSHEDLPSPCHDKINTPNLKQKARAAEDILIKGETGAIETKKFNENDPMKNNISIENQPKSKIE